MAGTQPVRSIPTFGSALGAVAERHARALNRATATICAEAPRASFVPLTAPPNPSPDRYSSKEDYRHWAEILAVHLAAELDAERLGADSGLGRSAAQDAEEMEEERRRAVETLRILDTDPEHRFDRIVALAQRAFGTRSAAFGVSDGGRLWGKTTVGEAVKDVPRSGSLSAVAIAGPGPLVVGDTLADERFHDHPLVLGEPYTRFYAGYPIESPSGERIGVLCVFDPEPRPADEVDTVLLREFALMLQRELLRHPRVSGSTSIASQGGNPNATLARDQ